MLYMTVDSVADGFEPVGGVVGILRISNEPPPALGLNCQNDVIKVADQFIGSPVSASGRRVKEQLGSSVL